MAFARQLYNIIDIASNIKYASTFSNADNIYENPL